MGSLLGYALALNVCVNDFPVAQEASEGGFNHPPGKPLGVHGVCKRRSFSALGFQMLTVRLQLLLR